MLRDANILQSRPAAIKVIKNMFSYEGYFCIILFNKKFTNYIAIINRVNLVATDRTPGWKDVNLSAL